MWPWWGKRNSIRWCEEETLKEEAIVLCPSILQSVLISQSNLLMSLITNENPLIFFCLGRLIADMNIPSSTSSHSRQLCINHLKRNINIEVDAYVSSFINKIMSIPNQPNAQHVWNSSTWLAPDETPWERVCQECAELSLRLLRNIRLLNTSINVYLIIL